MPEFEQTTFSGLTVQRSSATGAGALTELTNALVAPDGSIRSRAGVLRINTAQNNDGLGSTNIHTSVNFEDQRYIGVGTVIRRGYEPTDPAIITGLNGSRVSCVHMAASPAANNKNFTYFANGQVAARKKDNVTATSNWGIDGPTASAVNAITPTVGANQPTTTTIDTFALAYTAQDGFGTETAATSAYATSAREFTVPSGKVERFRRTGLTLNLSTQGEVGFVRIMLRVNNRQNLSHVEVALSLDGGVFTNDYYTTRIRAIDFTADKTWQEFKISKHAFTRVKLTGGSTKTWANVDGVQVTVGANSKGQVIVSADDARVEADTHANGTFDYKITLWNDTLKIRSNSRRLADVYSALLAITGQITVHRQRITVARPSDFASWDPQVTHWELWRRNIDVSGEHFFVARTAVANTTYDDDFNDLALGEALLDDSHIPPVSKRILEYEGSVWWLAMSNQTTGSGEEEAPWAIRYSRRSYPESAPLTNYVLVSTPTDRVFGGCVWSNNLYIWTQEKIKRIQGQGGSYIAIDTEAPIGTNRPYSIASSPYGVFYSSMDGVYIFTGGTAQKISTALDPIFRRETIVLDGFTIYPMDADQPAEAESVVGAFANGRYVLSYTDTNGTRTTLFYDIQFQRWFRAQNTVIGSGWDIQTLRWEKGGVNEPSDNLEAGTADGWFIKLDSAVNQAVVMVDGGNAAIPFAVQTKAFDAELKPTKIEADIKNIFLDVDTGGQSLTVQASFNGEAYVSLGTISTATRDKVYIPINTGVGTIAFRVAVRISANLSTARVSLFSIGFNYLEEPVRVTEFSTEFTTLQWPGKKYLQELVLEANTFGVNVVVSVEADGVVLAQTFTLNTSNRLPKVFSFNLPNPLATEIRLRFDPTGSNVEWKLYSFDLTTLKEPLEVSRIALEKSDEGWPGEKLFKTLAVEIDDLGTAATVEMFVDDVSIGTFTTPATAKRDVYYFSLTDSVTRERRGAVWYATVSSAATFRLYRAWVDHDREPERNTFYKTQISDAGFQGEKRFRTVRVDIDTFGATVTVVPYVDGVAYAGLVGAAITTTGRKELHISMGDVRGRNISITLASGSAVQFAFYGVNYDFESEGLTATHWFTQHSDAGYPGEKRFRTINLDIDTFNAAVTLTPFVDGVAVPGLIASVITTATRKQIHVSFPDVRGRLIAVKLESAVSTRFIFYGVNYDFESEGLTSTYFFTQTSDAGYPGEKRFRTINLDIDTFGAAVTLTPYIDGVAQAGLIGAVITTTGRRMLHVSLNDVRGRLIAIKLESAASTRFIFYGIQYDFESEGLTSTYFFTQTSDAGYPGEKRFRTINLDIDTFGAAVTLTPYIDGVAQVGLIGTVFTTTGRRMLHVSCNDVRGRLIAIKIESAASTRFIFYGIQYDFESEGLTATHWFTQHSDAGYPGEKRFRTINLDINTFGAAVTLTPYVDGVAIPGLIASTITTTTRKQLHVSFPDQRGRLISVKIESAVSTRFIFYGVTYDFESEGLTSTYFFTQTSDAGYPGEKRFRTINLDIDTFGAAVTLTPFVDGVAVPGLIASAITTATRKQIHVSFPDQRGRLIAVKLESAVSTRFIFYGVNYDFESEGLTATYWFTQTSDAGYPGEKRFRTINLDIDTFGAAVTLTPYIDGVAQAGLIGAVFTTAGRRMLHVSCNDARGRLISLKLESAVSTRFIFYGVNYDFESEGLTATYWFTQTSDAGTPGDKRFRTIILDLDTLGANITVTPYIDGVAVTALIGSTFSATGRKEQHISLPDVRGRNVAVKIESADTTRFIFYGIKYDFESEGLTSTYWFNQWSDEGYPAEKAFQQVFLDIDTRAANTTLTVAVDQVAVHSETINTTGRLLKIVSLPTTPEGKLIQVTIVAAATTRFLFYSARYKFVQRPPGITFLDTTPQHPFMHAKGWLRRGRLRIKNTATVTGTIWINGVAAYTFTIAGDPLERVVIIQNPIGLTGEIVRITLASAVSFQVFPSVWEMHSLDQDRSFEAWQFVQ